MTTSAAMASAIGMAPKGHDFRGLPGCIDGLPGYADAGGGLQCNADEERLTGGNPTEYSARVIVHETLW